MKTNDTKRKTLTDIMALAKSMKGDAMKKKYAPPVQDLEGAEDDPLEGSPEEEDKEDASEEAMEDGTSTPDSKSILMQLQADPEKLKALLSKMKK